MTKKQGKGAEAQKDQDAMRMRVGKRKDLSIRDGAVAALMIVCVSLVSLGGLVTYAMIYGDKPAEQGSTSD